MSVRPENAFGLKKSTELLLLSDEQRHAFLHAVYDPAWTVTWTDSFGVAHTFSTRAGTSKANVGQVKVGSRTLQVTHAASLDWERVNKPEYWYSELSHTCGIAFCLTHIWWELPWDNLWRDGCHKYNHFSQCPHLPSCLDQTKEDHTAAVACLHEAIRERRAPPDAETAAKRARNAGNYQENREARAEKSKKRQRTNRGTQPENYRK
jgi:hypothetical protein